MMLLLMRAAMMIIRSSNVSITRLLSISSRRIMIVAMIIAFVWWSMSLIYLWLTRSFVNILISLHEFESFCILHSRLILNWFLVLLVIERDIVRIKIQELSQFVWDICSHLFISTVLKPDLNQSFLSSQWEPKPNDFWFFKLFT